MLRAQTKEKIMHNVTGPVIFQPEEPRDMWARIRSKILKYMPQVPDAENR